MLILAILGAGMGVGAIAQLILGRAGYHLDWSMALVAGVGGSFVGGLLVSLISGDGLDIRPSGLIGSIVGALIVTAAWMRFDSTKKKEATQARRR
ncbi:MAG: GlsB/YeaQ/YmgE family stress response membrane protein [Acidimicrobiales bacterium]